MEARTHCTASFDVLSQAPDSPLKSNRADIRTLFFQIVSQFLGVRVWNVQGGFGFRADMYLFEGPNGTTLTVDCGVMLLRQPEAREIVKTKVVSSLNSFLKEKTV